MESRYKSPATKRREYCESTTYNAKVGTDLIYEFNSRSYDVDRVINKIQELERTVQDLDRLKYHDETNKSQEESLSESSVNRINDLKEAHRTVIACLREMKKIKMFLEDENSWWKILKGRSVDCCQQKMPHLHGVLDGASVTLILFEEGTDEVPPSFVTPTSKEESNGSRFGTSSKELASETKRVEQYTDRQPEHTDEYENSYTIPYYSLDVKSALIEVTSTDSYEPTQRYVKRTVTSDESIAASEFWTEVQEDESDGHERTKTPERLHSDECQRAKTPERSHRSKETTHSDNTQCDAKEKIDRSNIMPSREMRYDQNFQTFEDSLKSREAFSSENNENKKYTNDFESNVDLNTEIPARNMSSRKPRLKTIVEKSARCIQTKFPTSRIKNRD